jgi:hypothetical protein
VLMTRVRSTEEPCAAKVARTVLKTSGGSDPLAEFNRALRPGVLWRKGSFGTQSRGIPLRRNADDGGSDSQAAAP